MVFKNYRRFPYEEITPVEDIAPAEQAVPDAAEEPGVVAEDDSEHDAELMFLFVGDATPRVS